MALIPIDDWLFPTTGYSLSPYQRYRSHYNPAASVLSSVFNDGFRELQRLERELGDVELNSGNSNALVFRCNVAGYRPEELKVGMENNQLVIHGEHKHEADGQSIHRTFVRRMALPEDVERESIECNLNEKGQLEVKAQRKAIESSNTHNIPIGFKQSSTTGTIKNDGADTKSGAGAKK